MVAPLLTGCGGAFKDAVSAEAAPSFGSARSFPEGGAPPAAPSPAGAPAAREAPPAEGEQRPDPGGYLVHEATVTVGVYQVSQGVTAVLDIARKADGHVVFRDDTRVTFRVPRARFEDALGRIDGVGDVVHRDVHAEDVGDQFRDLEVRVKNARAMRDRLEQLLSRAGTVEDSLKIEAQLSRLTEEIERLSGSMLLLSHRIQYSKITVLFQARHVEEVHDEVLRLPFPFLSSLGLSGLLDLRE